MSFSPQGALVRRGAIIGYDTTNRANNLTIFQYNPHQLTRSLTAKMAAGDDGDRGETLRLNGAPVETINLDVEIDAADQLNDTKTQPLGIYPQLSALEVLLYPKSSDITKSAAQLAAGTLEIIPGAAPLTLLVWGAQRVVPIRITSFSVTEEAHDLELNPIRATVALGLQVLSYNNFLPNQPGYQLFMAYQSVKETLAKQNDAMKAAIPDFLGNLGR